MRQDLDTKSSGDTVDLWWNRDKGRKIALKNLQTGETYSFELRRRFTVGRSEVSCNLRITETDKYISGKHLCFLRDRNAVYIEDMHTKNGTRLNGKRIRSKTRIHQGDIIQMGQSDYEIIF